MTEVTGDDEWLRRRFELARLVSGWSKDPTTKVGAVIVGYDLRDVAVGYNGFPPRVRDTSARLDDRECKRKLSQHAERNVLDNARFSCSGATLVSTMFPCLECAKSVVSKGVARVVAPSYENLHEPWKTSCAEAYELLRETLVEVIFFDGS